MGRDRRPAGIGLVPASLIGASVNAVFGLLVAWVLARYSLPGKRVIDALVDLPFTLPTAVAGIALTAVYVNLFHGRVHAGKAWIGEAEVILDDHHGISDAPALLYVRPHDIEVARKRNGYGASRRWYAKFAFSGQWSA